ncbi:MAG TPA: hypothetical protein DCL54_03435 [Alphaproteobacteria bacterium]|nr:hypothetical protein [Alphaproteobacteria bacterium]
MWNKGGPKGDPIPYKLPELLAAQEAPVFICEGEKDADNLNAWGLIATTNSGGAGNWHQALDQWFAGRTVYVLADNDEPGRKHAERVAYHLGGKAAQTKVIDLPGLPPKGDVTDWIAAGGKPCELLTLCHSLPDARSITQALPSTVLERPSAKDQRPSPSPIHQSKAANYGHRNQAARRRWDFDEPQDHVVAKRWIMKGLLARGETSGWIAPPKAGKSALVGDLCVAVAAGQNWRGKRSKERCAVVYFALERGDLVRRRLIATMRRDGITTLPIRLVAGNPDFATPHGITAIINEINEASTHFGLSVGLIVFDTYAKLIAANGGDEDKASDQAALLAKISEVNLEVDCHVALIGHTGKDQSKGPRGSNAFGGNYDFEVRIKGEDHRTASIVEANDAPEGVLTTFTMEGFELGRDEDGDPIDIGIVARDAPAQADAQEAGLAQRKLSPSQRIAFEALCEAINEAGELQPGNPRIPAGQRAVNEDLWRQYAYKRSISNATQDAKLKAFTRAVEALLASHHVSTWDGFYWVNRGQS